MIEPKDIEHKLDQLYSHGFDGYAEHLDMVKGLGYKVYRNSDGKHKIRIREDYLDDAFGGIFKNCFGGG